MLPIAIFQTTLLAKWFHSNREFQMPSVSSFSLTVPTNLYMQKQRSLSSSLKFSGQQSEQAPDDQFVPSPKPQPPKHWSQEDEALNDPRNNPYSPENVQNGPKEGRPHWPQPDTSEVNGDPRVRKGR